MLQYLTIVLHYQKTFMTIVNQLPMMVALALAAPLFRSLWASYHASLVPLPIRVDSRNII
jgi:hypothetical protein